jgi:hypothetical protein
MTGLHPSSTGLLDAEKYCENLRTVLLSKGQGSSRSQIKYQYLQGSQTHCSSDSEQAVFETYQYLQGSQTHKKCMLNDWLFGADGAMPLLTVANYYYSG